MMAELNKCQVALAKSYGMGDYAYIADLSYDAAMEAAKKVGDTLFTFLMIELADEGEYKMTVEEACQRIARAADDLAQVNSVLEGL
jgi:hypothetical protein